MNNKSPVIISSFVLVEWFEYSIYLYLSSYIAKSIMPHIFRNSMVIIYVIFAISYLSRPIGGVLLGFISDKWGRKRSLLISGYTMTLSTLLIGLIPNYDAIGAYAPLLLLLLRFTQSIAAGGEFNNSAILLMENTRNKKVLLGSWTGFASSAGMVLGSFSAIIISMFFNNDYSWRFAYYIAFLISIITLILRHNINESNEFNHLGQYDKYSNKFKELLKYKISILLVFISGAFVSIYVYGCMVYFIHFYSTVTTQHKINPILVVMITQLLVTLCIPVMAIIGTKYQYSSILKLCILGVCLSAMLLFTSTANNNLHELYIAISIYAVCGAGVSALIFRYMYNLFPTHIRCLGTSLSWGVSAAIFGATTPIISNIFVKLGFINFPWIYISFFGIIFIILQKLSQGVLHNK